MDSIISVQDIRTTLGAIVKRAERGESFTVIKNSKPAFRIIPLEKMAYEQAENRPALTLHEIRSRFEADPVSANELSPDDLDDIIHEIHKEMSANPRER